MIKNAVISSASITTADRGLLDAWLNLDYGGSGQGFDGSIVAIGHIVKDDWFNPSEDFAEVKGKRDQPND